VSGFLDGSKSRVPLGNSLSSPSCVPSSLSPMNMRPVLGTSTNTPSLSVSILVMERVNPSDATSLAVTLFSITPPSKFATKASSLAQVTSPVHCIGAVSSKSSSVTVMVTVAVLITPFSSSTTYTKTTSTLSPVGL